MKGEGTEGSFYQRGWVMIMSNVWNCMYTVYSQFTHAGVECLVPHFFFFSLASLIYKHVPFVMKRKELRNVDISFKFK